MTFMSEFLRQSFSKLWRVRLQLPRRWLRIAYIVCASKSKSHMNIAYIHVAIDRRLSSMPKMTRNFDTDVVHWIICWWIDTFTTDKLVWGPGQRYRLSRWRWGWRTAWRWPGQLVIEYDLSNLCCWKSLQIHRVCVGGVRLRFCRRGDRLQAWRQAWGDHAYTHDLHMNHVILRYNMIMQRRGYSPRSRSGAMNFLRPDQPCLQV